MATESKYTCAQIEMMVDALDYVAQIVDAITWILSDAGSEKLELLLAKRQEVIHCHDEQEKQA